MAELSPGDIVIANVPFEENPTILKKRPAMVISRIDSDHYIIVKITKTNSTGKIKGIWIDEPSREFKEMGLNFPSFINLQRLISVHKSFILSPSIGKYRNIANLLKDYKIS